MGEKYIGKNEEEMKKDNTGKTLDKDSTRYMNTLMTLCWYMVSRLS
jgi:hypothetical protein